MNCKCGQEQKRSCPLTAIVVLLFFSAHMVLAPAGGAYVLNYVVADMRQPGSRAGVTACPQRMRFDASASGSVNRQWSTSLGTNPATILTSDQTSAGRLGEIDSVISQSFTAWSSISGSNLSGNSLLPLGRTANANACAADGLNTVCFNQSDAAFTTGVLAFTRVITADTIGQQISASAPASVFVGQILDADILIHPGDSTIRFATPAALPGNPAAYDLASVLTHETGHMFGLGHSGIWRAMMFPFVPSPGTFAGARPDSQTPDAPLSDDDRSAIRALYPDPSDASHIGSIAGRILPASTLSLSGQPAGTSGIFAAQVVAVDNGTGAIAGAALSGWSCSDPGPPVFDGSYRIAGLLIGPSQTYQLYAEPLDGPETATDALEQITLCRNTLTDPGWPAQLACITPTPPPPFSTALRRAP
jgi:hypothetical protein